MLLITVVLQELMNLSRFKFHITTIRAIPLIIISEIRIKMVVHIINAEYPVAFRFLIFLRFDVRRSRKVHAMKLVDTTIFLRKYYIDKLKKFSQ